MTAPQCVYGDGPVEARIAVIGQNPGVTELADGRPFVGYSGNLWKRWIADPSVNLRREDLYVDNLFPYLVKPESRPKEEFDYFAALLKTKLSAMPNLRVVATLGDWPTSALVNKGHIKWIPEADRVGIGKLRGSIFEWVDNNGRSVKVIPTLHPSSLFLRGGKKQGVTKGQLEKRCLRDWQRISHEAKFEGLYEPPRRYIIDPTEHEAEQFVREVESAGIEMLMSIDIETANDLSCVGFSYDPSFAITLPTGSQEQKNTFLPYIRRLCESQAQKIFQNGHYDTYWLHWYGIEVTNWLWDLMYMHHAFDPRESHSLDFLSSIYLPFHRFWKDEAKSPEEIRKYAGNLEALWTYCGMDNCIQRELWNHLYPSLVESGQLSFYFQHYVKLFEPLLNTGLHGISLDADRQEKMRAQLKEERKLTRDELTEVAGEDLIAKEDFSKAKLQRFFHERLKLPKQYKMTKKKDGSKSKSETLDVNALAKLAYTYKEAARPTELVLQYRSATKALSTWLNPKKADKDGRIRCQYGMNTEAGRLNSKENPRQSGYNLQNTKRELRRIYVPDAGCCLLEIDLSQAEDREVKMYCGTPRMIELANRKPWEYDVHTHNAAMIFRVPEDKVEKKQRNLGKVVAHGAERAMTGEKLSKKLLTDFSQFYSPRVCQDMIDRFYTELWEIPKLYFPKVRRWIMERGYLRNSWGRVWNVKGETLGDDLYREGYSFLPQSETADQMNQWGFIPVYQWFKTEYPRLHSRINIQRHDALVMSVPFVHLFEVSAYVLTSLERTRMIEGNPLVVPGTIKIGPNDGEGIEFKRLPGSKADLLEQVVEYYRTLDVPLPSYNE